MDAKVWWHRNSHTFRITNLKNTATGAYINAGGTVQITKVVDEKGVAVSGVTVPVAFAPVSGTTTGEWTASVSGTLATAAGRRYWAIIEINPSSEPRGYARVELIVREREE